MVSVGGPRKQTLSPRWTSWPRWSSPLISPMADMDTGSAANDASGDNMSLRDEVLNTYKECDITGEEVFAEIENLPSF